MNHLNDLIIPFYETPTHHKWHRFTLTLTYTFA